MKRASIEDLRHVVWAHQLRYPDEQPTSYRGDPGRNWRADPFGELHRVMSLDNEMGEAWRSVARAAGGMFT